MAWTANITSSFIYKSEQLCRALQPHKRRCGSLVYSDMISIAIAIAISFLMNYEKVFAFHSLFIHFNFVVARLSKNV